MSRPETVHILTTLLNIARDYGFMFDIGPGEENLFLLYNPDNPFMLKLLNLEYCRGFFYERFNAPSRIPDSYQVYREGSYQQTVFKRDRQFMRNANDIWVTPPVVIDESLREVSIGYLAMDESQNAYVALIVHAGKIQLTYSEPNWRIWKSTVYIVEHQASFSNCLFYNLMVPHFAIQIAYYLIVNIIARSVRLSTVVANHDGYIRFWIQVIVERLWNRNEKELNRVTFTSDLMKIEYIDDEDELSHRLISHIALWLMFHGNNVRNYAGDTEYYELVDDSSDFGHIKEISISFFAPAHGGCNGFYGNRYSSNKLRIHTLYDPTTTYNNCLFWCLLKFADPNHEPSNEDCEFLRNKLGFKSGLKISEKELNLIIERMKLHLNLYIIEKTEGIRRYVLSSSKGDINNDHIALVLNAGHYCLVRDEERLVQWYSCPKCYVWYIGTSEKGENHIANCKKCDICGLRKAKNHKCRSQRKPRRKSVKYDKITDIQLDGVDNVYIGDFETFMDKGNMVVYAACWSSVNGIISPDPYIDCHHYYGQDSITKFTISIASKSGYLVFYNGSRFDCYFLMRELINLRIPITKIIRDKKSGKIMSLHFNKMKTFDLCLFTLSSLDKLCRDLSIPKEYCKSSFDHKKISSWETVEEHKNEVQEYLSLDVIALGLCYHRFISLIWNIHKYNAIKCVTLSNLAYDIWRNKYISPDYLSKVKVSTLEEYKFLRKALFGGRCCPQRKAFLSDDIILFETVKKLPISTQRTVFEGIQDYLEYFDVVSLYPFVAKRDFPIGTPEWKTNLDDYYHIFNKPYYTTTDKEKKLLQRSFLKVDIQTPNDILTCFLFTRDDKGNPQAKLGTFTNQIYDGLSLYHAMEIGYKILNIHAPVLVYPTLAPILDSFMSVCFNSKAESPKESAEYMIHKIIMNGNTGKFNQSIIDNELSIFYDDDVFTEKFLEDVTYIEELKSTNLSKVAYLVETKRDEIPSKPLEVGVLVLAYSRILMHEYLNSWNGYRNEEKSLYYGDTDSLILHKKVYEENYSKKVFGDDWGLLKNEYPGGKIVEAYFPAPKTYALKIWCFDKEKGIEEKWVIRAKGIPKAANSSREAFIKLQTPGYTMEQDNIKDLRDVRFSLISRTSGEVIDSYPMMPFYFFKSMIMNEDYVAVDYASIKKSYFANNRTAFPVSLALDLRRLINENNWWKNGKRSNNSVFAQSYPPGHVKYG